MIDGFVNDASTDESIAILQDTLKNYPERQANVHILQNDGNHGLAYTRRVSIENAKGEYILCVDSDDYIEKELVECMVNRALETKADIVSAGFFHESATTQIELPYPCDNESDFTRIVLSDLLPYLCNKLIRRSLFTTGRNCYAPEGFNYLEDRITLLFLSTKVTRVVTINKPLYHYVYRTDSVSQSKNETHFRYLIRYWEEADRVLKELGLEQKYKDIVGTQKIADKAFHLMYCDNKTRKQFVDLFAAEDRLYHPVLTRGTAFMYWLVKHHLWALTYCYEQYIHWLDGYKKRHS